MLFDTNVKPNINLNSYYSHPQSQEGCLTCKNDPELGNGIFRGLIYIISQHWGAIFMGLMQETRNTYASMTTKKNVIVKEICYLSSTCREQFL